MFQKDRSNHFRKRKRNTDHETTKEMDPEELKSYILQKTVERINNKKEKKSKSKSRRSDGNADVATTPTNERTPSEVSACSPTDVVVANISPADMNHHLIRTTRAVIFANEKIWKKCQRKIITEIIDIEDDSDDDDDNDDDNKNNIEQTNDTSSTKKKKKEAANNNNNNDDENKKFIFNRKLYSIIEIDNTTDGGLCFTAISKSEQKNFGIPNRIPERLSNILHVSSSSSFPPNDDPYCNYFPDYHRFFQSVLLLNETLQEIFLTRLKDHLETIQIFLRNIDDWLGQSEQCADFINKKFDVNVRQQKNTTGTGTDNTNDSAASITTPANSHGSRIVLKKVLGQIKIPGEHNICFDITSETEKRRVKKFLKFVNSFN